jgi:hypothetical protein
MRILTPKRGALRSALSILAIYALVIQGVLTGVVASQTLRLSGADAIICVAHDDGRAAQDVPADHSGCMQCSLCAAAHLSGALHDVPLGGIGARGNTFSWRGAAWRAPALFESESAQPRGPPVA